jgi:hypothetical protein
MNYQFIMDDEGTNVRVSDGGVFASTSFFRMLEEKRANIPAADVLPDSSDKHHFVFAGDKAFPLKEYLMKPYNQRDLNTDQRIYTTNYLVLDVSLKMHLGNLHHVSESFRLTFIYRQTRLK